MSADFTGTWDVFDNNENGKSIGAFVVQDIDEWALQVYGGYRYYNVDRRDINL